MNDETPSLQPKTPPPVTVPTPLAPSTRASDNENTGPYRPQTIRFVGSQIPTREVDADTLPVVSQLPAIPGYEILGKLGEGGMGVVYKARDVQLKRLVAIKMVQGTQPHPRLLQRFRTEAEAVARLQHP